MSNPVLFASQRATPFRLNALWDSIIRSGGGGEPGPTPFICAYPLDATAGELAGPGYTPMSLSGQSQTALVTLAPGQGSFSYLAAPAGFSDNTNAVFPMETGITVIEFAFPDVSPHGIFDLSATVVGGDFMTTVIQITQSGNEGAFSTTCGTFTDSSTYGEMALAFDADTGDITLYAAGVSLGVVGTFTPGNSFAVTLNAAVAADQPAEAAGEILVVQVRTSLEEMMFAADYPAMSKTICGEVIKWQPLDIYPAYWSLDPADRGYHVTSNHLRTVTRSGGSGWTSIRTNVGITAGQKIATEFLIGSASTTIVGIGAADATTGSYLGSEGSGFGYYSANGAILHSGGTVATGATFTAGDKILVETNLVDDEVEFFKWNGSAWVSQAVVDISSLSGTIYPMASCYSATIDTVTLNAGHAEPTGEPSAGFTMGPLGPWHPAHITTLRDVWIYEDLTRLDTAHNNAINVSGVGDPVGKWTGQLDSVSVTQGSSANRPEYAADGVLLDASGGVLKALNVAFARAYNDPLTVWARVTCTSEQAIRIGSTNSATPALVLTGLKQSGVGGTNWRVTARVTETVTDTTQTADSFLLVAFNGVDAAHVLNDDGTWVDISGAIGVDTTDGTTLTIRAIAADLAVAKVDCWGIVEGAVTEEDARFLQWWARNRA